MMGIGCHRSVVVVVGGDHRRRHRRGLHGGNGGPGSSSLSLSLSSSLWLFLLILFLSGSNDGPNVGIRWVVEASEAATETMAGSPTNEVGPEDNTSSSSSSIVVDPLVEIATDLVDWFRSRGGYMNDKLEIRRRDPTDPYSPAGVFARADLDVDELILTIPRAAQLSVLNGGGGGGREEEEKVVAGQDDAAILRLLDGDYHDTLCLLAHRLLQEIQSYHHSPPSATTAATTATTSSSSSSEYGPYIRYLQETQSRGQLPASYSPEGKAVLRQIQGIQNYQRQGRSRDISDHYGESPLPPSELVDWIEDNFQSCFSKRDPNQDQDNDTTTEGLTEETIHAIATVVQRGYDLELIPIWDMVNHDIPERINVETSSLRASWMSSKYGRDRIVGRHHKQRNAAPDGDDGDGDGPSTPFQIRTTEPIQAGQEILYTYNYCTDCYDIGTEWGAPGIFRDFGFLEENYPQEWPFLDQGVYSVVFLLSDDNEEPKTVKEIQEGSTTVFPYKGRNYRASFLSESYQGKQRVYAPKKDDLEFFRFHQARLQSFDLTTALQNVPSPYERFWIEKFYDSMLIAISTVINAGVDYHRLKDSVRAQQQSRQKEEEMKDDDPDEDDDDDDDDDDDENDSGADEL